jgi:putative NIF3 family GTP cyclohydrolase 1 type 2
MQAKLQSISIKQHVGDDFQKYLTGDMKVQVYQEVGTIFNHVVDVDHTINVFLSRMPKDVQVDVQKLWDKISAYIEAEVNK